MAGRWMSSYFNRPGFDMIGYDTYAVCGDGDLIESISS